MSDRIHLEFLVEEPSAKAFLDAWLPRILPEPITWASFPFRSKHDLLKKLGPRLLGYTGVPQDYRIFVLVDRDQDDCQVLKRQLESASRSLAAQLGPKIVFNRIVIEELEAWYFGDWQAVCDAFDGLPDTLRQRRRYRESDAIVGGTWEALEQVMRKAGHFKTGLRKVELAMRVGQKFDASRCDSHSFQVFFRALRDCISGAV